MNFKISALILFSILMNSVVFSAESNLNIESSKQDSLSNLDTKPSFQSTSSSCLPILAPYCEDFEDSSWVGYYPSFGPGFYGSIGNCWSRSDSTGFIWSFKTGASSWNSSGPGPFVVSTTGKYMFTQPDGNSPINSTSITTPWFDLTALDTPAVYFKSHLYGADIQSLSVEIDFGNGWTSASGPNTLISLAPTQQRNSPWQQNIVNLLQYQNDTVRFRITGTRNAFFAKIAVDDFCIDEAPFCPPVVASFYDYGNFLSRGFVASNVPNNAQCTWDFGDGSSGSGTPAFHTYSTPGSYNVKLTIQLPCGFIDDTTQTINVCSSLGNPVFTFQDSGFTYNFQVSSGGSGSSGFLWDFGDGNFGSGATVSHTYSSSGVFNVTLKSYNNCKDTNSFSSIIDICDPTDSIVANWTAQLVSTGPAGMIIDFDAEVSLGATYYKWYFGDGDSGVGKVVTHTYNPPGLFYNVTLAVSNDCNGADAITKSLTTIGTREEELPSNKIWPTILSRGQKLYFTTMTPSRFRNKVKIIDSRGRIMKDYKMSDGIEIPSHWPSGSYFIKIDDKTLKFFLTK